jgi:hypothetical protein
VGQIGDPIRQYTVIPLEDPVSPTKEPATSPPPNKAPSPTIPVTKPEPQHQYRRAQPAVLPW